jgi:hypothetical protein
MKREQLTVHREQLAVSNVKKYCLSLLFIAHCSLLILSGCDTHFDMPQNMAAGYGKVVVTINGTAARTVFPAMTFAKYEYLFAKVVDGTPGTPQAQVPVDGHFTLELGEWQVTVRAYAGAYDTVPAATGVSATFTVTGSTVAQAAVSLNGNAVSGEGRFVYTITYPAGAAISVFSLKNLRNENAAVINISASGANPLSGSLEVSAGYYFLTVQLTEGGGGRTTGANEVVYIYDRLDSEYHKTFSADDFSHIHDWNESYTTIIPVNETMNGIDAITCKHDPSHAKDPRFNGEYATGTTGLRFTLVNNNEYRVSRGTATGAIHIPAYHRPNASSPYLPVTGISSSAFGGTYDSPNTTVTSVTFATESPLTGIGWYAFSYCSSLTGIEIPAGVTSIELGAFSSCSSLTGINIPAGVTSIGDQAFQSCSSLTSIEIPASVTSIGSGAFSICSSLTSVTIGEGVTSIGEQAFYGCSSLAGIEIPAGVTTIGDEAFSECSSLTSINIPAGVTSIGERAFYSSSLTSITVDVNNLTYASQDGILYNKAKTSILNVPASISGSINIPASVTAIGNNAFFGCSNLTGIEIPAGVTAIGDNAFSCYSLTSITVDVNNLAYASQDGILYNKAKTSILNVPAGISGSINIPASVTAIGDYAFYGCSSLTSVTIPASVTTIGNYAFSNCFDSLTSVNIPAGVTSIGNGAFSFCYSLTGIEIPAGVTTIGPYAFSYCTGLTSVTCLPTTPPSLPSFWLGSVGWFNETHANLAIKVPLASVNAYQSASGWSEYASRISGIE